MPDRWHPADRIARRHARLVAGGPPNLGSTHRRAEAGGIQSVVAGDEGHDRLAVGHEDQRLDDLADLAPDGPRRVLGRACLLAEAHDVDQQAGFGRGLRHAGDVAVHRPAFIGHGLIMPRVLPSRAQPKSDRGARQR